MKSSMKDQIEGMLHDVKGTVRVRDAVAAVSAAR